jgi:uncharacterized protein YdaU (DUF1376 family)
MSKDPAFLFYSSDFLNGVSDLTMEERGQYITLLCLQHQKGSLSEKTVRLTVGSVSVDVMRKFEKDEQGNYFQSRLKEEIEKRVNFTESRRNNGFKGGRPKASEKPSGYPTPNLMENVNENVNEDKNINIDFDYFWNDYDKKVGDKSRLKSKWNKLSDNDRNQIMNYLPLYIEAVPDKQFRKNPETFLNNKSWLDEIVKRTTPDYNKQSYAEREFAKLKSL